MPSQLLHQYNFTNTILSFQVFTLNLPSINLVGFQEFNVAQENSAARITAVNL
jgi:hypothetical protein